MESKGIATRFKGVDFRSRLEAKWAHVFDKLGWEWLYEPIDLEGWIPDFLIRCKGSHDLLIDIKPIARFDSAEAFEQIARKIDFALDATDQRYSAAVLGIAPSLVYGDLTIGRMRHPEPFICVGLDTARFTSCGGGDIGLNQIDGDWTCQIHGKHSKHLDEGDRFHIELAFRDAANAVQWNKKTPRHIADVLGSMGLR